MWPHSFSSVEGNVLGSQRKTTNDTLKTANIISDKDLPFFQTVNEQEKETLWPIPLAEKKQKERHKVTFFVTSAIKIHNFITLLLFFFLVQLMSAILPLLDLDWTVTLTD